MRTFRKFLALMIGAMFVLSSPQSVMAAPTIRDQAIVVVGGAKELWQLKWAEKPSPVCGVSDPEDAMTCPCYGFAYGEKGHLSLLRIREGRLVERMDLDPLFGGGDAPSFGDVRGMSYLQRWPEADHDFDRLQKGDPSLAAEIAKRHTPKALKFADYNRDGAATKFLLRVGNAPCGRGEYLALGVSAKEGHLHALTSAEEPTKPLVMFENEWNALLTGPGEHRVVDWRCGDHGSDVENDAILSAALGVIHLRSDAYSCKSDGSRGELLKVHPNFRL